MSDEEASPRKAPRSHGKKIIPAGMTMERVIEIAIQAEDSPMFERIEPYPRTWKRRATKNPEL